MRQIAKELGVLISSKKLDKVQKYDIVLNANELHLHLELFIWF